MRLAPVAQLTISYVGPIFLDSNYHVQLINNLRDAPVINKYNKRLYQLDILIQYPEDFDNKILYQSQYRNFSKLINSFKLLITKLKIGYVKKNVSRL